MKYSKVRYAPHACRARMLEPVICALGLRCLLGLSWKLYLCLPSSDLQSHTLFQTCKRTSLQDVDMQLKDEGGDAVK